MGSTELYLASADESFVNTKEALALELNDGAVLHVAQGRLSDGKRRLATVGIDKIFDVLALKKEREGQVRRRGGRENRQRANKPLRSSFS